MKIEDIIDRRYMKDDVLRFLKQNPLLLSDAVQFAISNHKDKGWRAAWLIDLGMKEDDPQLQKHSKALIKAIKNKRDGHQRELLKVVSRMNLNDKLEGMLFDQCMTLWTTTSKIPSLRYTAFRILMKIANKYPELKPELKHLTDKHFLDPLTHGAKRSVQRLIKENLI